jgi:hypothetical protein
VVRKVTHPSTIPALSGLNLRFEVKALRGLSHPIKSRLFIQPISVFISIVDYITGQEMSG